MVVDSAIRWKLVRDVIVNKKSGVIVLQTGTNYLNWTIKTGNLVSISSTYPEASFTHFIQEKQLIESTKFLNAQNQIDPDRALGSILLRLHLLNEQELSAVLFQYWISCTDYLFDPSVHLFWSMNAGVVKPEFVRSDRPLGDVIIRANKNSVTVPTALRSVQELKPPYRLHSPGPDRAIFSEEERRVWMYLQSGSSLKQMFQDPDIARIPCYKTLFLLWVCGYISDTRNVASAEAQKVATNMLQRIPPEWIFPLCAGVLIGVLLVPSSPPAVLPASDTRVQPLNEVLQKPAWSSNDDEEFNAKAQRREDDE